jgi:2-oxoglutarate dehydrogenase E2 component (dihydrolipoamide succinyltransferase)
MDREIDVLAPALEDGTAAVVLRWLKRVGDRVEEHEPLLELETDKVTVEVPAPASGELTAILCKEQSSVTPGLALAQLRLGPAAPRQAKTPPAADPTRPAAAAEPLLSPAVRRLLAEHRLSAQDIPGTGRDGRVTAADVTRHASRPGGTDSGTAPAHTAAPVAARPAAERSRHVAHSVMRRRIAAHMVQSMATAPHVTSVFAADLTRVFAHRAQAAPALASEGVRLTLTAYFVRAAVAALAAVPEANATFHDDSLEIYADANIGVATALGDDGLIVPVLHQAQVLDLAQTARGLAGLVESARAGTLAPADVRGGTFTISNHGVSGSLLAAPIVINQPQVAILGVGKVERRVVVQTDHAGDSLAVRPMCYLTLTVDHRALDGFQANRFLSVCVATLESWP